MQKAVKNICLSVLATLMLFVSTMAFLACSPIEPPEDFGPDLSMLHIEGDKVYNSFGEPVLLQGVNAGGYLLLEGWMTGFSSSAELDSYGREGVWSAGVDHYKVSKAFSARFGRAKAVELWDNYRKNFWTEQDFINCKEMGMNVIRLPFTYMSVDPAYDNVAAIDGQKYNFSLLEDFVNRAKKHGMYTILDLHGAYGSQNGKDHSGERQQWDKVDFYSNEQKQQQTIDLWSALTEHFKDNPNIAAFDMLNEPGELNESGGINLTTTRHYAFFDKVYKAMREIDSERIVIFESCWGGNNLPMPELYGWTHNVIYSFHHYTGRGNAYPYVDKDGVAQKGHINEFMVRIDDVNGRNFGVPVYMGEFTCYGDVESWTPTLTALQESNWHWTTWTYKVKSGNGAWGIYTMRTDNVAAEADSYEQIIEKFKGIQTSASTTQKYKFNNSDSTLYDIIQENCQREIEWIS